MRRRVWRSDAVEAHAASCVGASTTWRIRIDAVQGAGNQVQLTEAAFLLGEDQLGGGVVAPVISPGGAPTTLRLRPVRRLYWEVA